jgi:hypothetical protein
LLTIDFACHYNLATHLRDGAAVARLAIPPRLEQRPAGAASELADAPPLSSDLFRDRWTTTGVKRGEVG